MSEIRKTTETTGFLTEPKTCEDKEESLSEQGGQGGRAYHELVKRSLTAGWPIPDKAKAKAVLIAMQDISHPSARVRAAATRNLALLDGLNVKREAIAQRADAISKLTETPLLSREDLLTNLEVLRQQRLLLAQEEATESTKLQSAQCPPTENLETQRLGQNRISELAVSPPHPDPGAQSPGPPDPA